MKKMIVKIVKFLVKIIKVPYIFIDGMYFKLFINSKKNINVDSKKLVYIGHSYHNKTKSTGFLLDYLREIFDVDELSDTSWDGGTFPDMSFIDNSYLGVVFFQMLPSKNILNNINNKNIIFFPMYDASGSLGYSYWRQYRHLKIINFSKTLHDKLKQWGFDSIYVQYFPESGGFVPGDKDEVFFWQRLTSINVNTAIKLVQGQDIKIHVHKVLDPPDQEFVAPSKIDEKVYNITYSEWFETRGEVWDVIKQKGIYIAPREWEGIGQSFLEAMAMGKAVIAVDNPTMNEYITHNETGYLFDLKNPKPINLNNIADVQLNTYNYMKNGAANWTKNKGEIIKFINSRNSS